MPWWKLSVFGLLLLSEWNAAIDVCGVDKIYRIDCFPEISPGIEKICAARGCCYDPGEVEATKSDEQAPWCFYPSNYSSYEVSSVRDNDHGFTAVLELGKSHKHRIVEEVPLLLLDVKYETESRLHFKITDAQNSRYEVPIDTPSVDKPVVNPHYEIKVHKKNFGLKVVSKHSGSVIFDSTIAPLIYANQFLQISSTIPSSKVYGLGERHTHSLVNLEWNRMVFWARDQQPMASYNLYGDHPFMMVVENGGMSFGVFLLNSNAKEVMMQPAPIVTWRTIGGVLDFYIFTGPSPKSVVQQYLEVIGKPFLPPYWGLGFHLCRWGYGTSNNTWRYVKEMRAAGIPQDVQWSDIEYAYKSLDFTYDNQTYDTLPDLVDDLHVNGQKYIMIVDPGISDQQPPGTYPPYDEGLALGVFVNQSGKDAPIEGKVWPGQTAFPDFLNPATKGYWRRQLESYHQKVPFDGVWIDMNEPSNFVSGSTSGCPASKFETPPYLPKVIGGALNDKTLCMTSRHHHQHLHYDVHSLYGLFEMIATHEAMVKIRNKRPFIISRSSFPSTGRYGGHWTGDIHSTWSDMRQSIVGITNFNLFGIPLIGADICGFAGSTTEQLCVRWMQLGAFYPFSRNHNSIDEKPQAPVDFSQQAQASIDRALRVRYSLLPYLYTLFYRAHTSGETVARGLYVEFPADEHSLRVDEQFMWGEALLISPVLYPDANTTDVYLPSGRWYDVSRHGVAYPVSMVDSEGGEWRNMATPLPVIPLHVRGGHVIATQPPDINTVRMRASKQLELKIYYDAASRALGTLYWDDGDSLDSVASGNFVLNNFAATDSTISITVEHAPAHSSAFNEVVFTNIALFGLPLKARKFVCDGRSLDFEYINPLSVFVAVQLKITENSFIQIIY